MALATCSILFRGLLDSCNYRCAYCSFSHSVPTPDAIEADAIALERFVRWIRRNTTHRLSILLAPAGEALLHPHYQRAIEELLALPHVAKVAAQTNLSWPSGWPAALAPKARAKLALWCTYHPTEVTLAAFLSRLSRLDDLGVPYSVGAVGAPDQLPALEELRDALPAQVYLWINALKKQVPLYTPAQRRRFAELDPLFEFNTAPHPSRGRACACGESVVSVLGGRIQRCFFVPEPIGHIGEQTLADVLETRPCPNGDCHCHIGYVHMPHLGLASRFGDGVLERIPTRLPRPGSR